MSTTLHIALWLACTAVAAFIVFKVLVSTDKKARHTGAQDARTTPNRNLRELLAHGAMLRMLDEETNEFIAVIDKQFEVIACANDAITATDKALHKLRWRPATQFGLSAKEMNDIFRAAGAAGANFRTFVVTTADAKPSNPAQKARP